jgi:manganese/iron transport system substrate-binding protein
MTANSFQKIITVFVLFVFIGACTPQAVQTPEAAQNEPIMQVVATTSILADVVRQVAGERVEVQSLIPPGSDPHSYQLTPRDMAAIAQADLVFMVGAGLEEFLDGVIERTGGNARLVPVSEGIELLEFEHEDEHEDENEDEHEDEQEDEHEEGDPHVWFDPNNVIFWVQGIELVLSQMDPLHSAVYAANAEAYIEQLVELDAWVQEQVAVIPVENRLLVTDHLLLGYFAERYGFEQVGAVFPGYSTMAEPSAQEMAALEDTIREMGVKAVFVGNTVNPQVSQRIAEDTGTQLVFFYTDSLTDEDGPASTYLDYIRYNVTVITEALK